MKAICMLASAVTLAAGSVAVRADDLPLRKPGLWDMKMAAKSPMPAITMQHCTDASTDKAMSAAASPIATETCSKNTVTKTASGYVTESVCTVAGKTSTTVAEITGDFDAAYTMRVTPQLSGGGRADTIVIEAKWVGACKPDQKPGDVMMPGGMKVNINDLVAARGKR